jgi:hypothetical protein
MTVNDGKTDETELKQIQQHREGIVYANRKRNLEWRRHWFYQIRPEDDQELLEVWLRGLRLKQQLIKSSAEPRITWPHTRPPGWGRLGSPQVPAT